MVMEFVIEKLEAHWNHIEIELGPRRWADFTKRYRAVAALDAQDTENYVRQLRELMTSTPCTARLWEEWRDEADFTRISVGAEVLGRVEKGREQRLQQLASRYRDLGASGAATPPAQPTSTLNAGHRARAERN